MTRAYITHATKNYLNVAHNLAKSIREFSDIPLVVYCIDVDKKDTYIFQDILDVYVEILNLNLDAPENVILTSTENFYVDRFSIKSFNVLSVKVLAMKHALESGWDEVCYLDSDCIATPIVDELFNWSNLITDYPIATKGVHEYMIRVDNSIQHGNPFLNRWPEPEIELTLEWPLMRFMGMSTDQRGTYRTTTTILMNQNCREFITLWWDFCKILPKLTNILEIAPYQEETIYNVLSWKKTNVGFPLSYINLNNGLETVKDFYTVERKLNHFVNYVDNDLSTHFYKIPEDKRNVKVLHGEKSTSEVNKILYYLKELKNNGYFENNKN